MWSGVCVCVFGVVCVEWCVCVCGVVYVYSGVCVEWCVWSGDSVWGVFMRIGVYGVLYASTGVLCGVCGVVRVCRLVCV